MEPTATPARPLPNRVVDTFVAPRRLAAGFRDRTPWVGVLLLSTAVAVIAAGALPDEFFLEQVEDPVNRRGRPVEVTSPPAEITRWGRYLAMLSALAAHPVVAFTLAGVLALAFTVVGGGRIAYRQYLALTAHALLILALGTLLAVALGWITGNPGAEISLAPLSPTEGGAVSRLLRALNPFTLWMLVVLGVGVGTLDPRRSSSSAVAILLALYLALAAVISSLPA